MGPSSGWRLRVGRGEARADDVGVREGGLVVFKPPLPVADADSDTAPDLPGGWQELPMKGEPISYLVSLISYCRPYVTLRSR